MAKCASSSRQILETLDKLFLEKIQTNSFMGIGSLRGCSCRFCQLRLALLPRIPPIYSFQQIELKASQKEAITGVKKKKGNTTHRHISIIYTEIHTASSEGNIVAYKQVLHMVYRTSYNVHQSWTINEYLHIKPTITILNKKILYAAATASAGFASGSAGASTSQ